MSHMTLGPIPNSVSYSICTVLTGPGCPNCSWTWVGLTLIWVFHHLRPAASAIFPSAHRQNWADNGMFKIQFNPTRSTSRWDTLYKLSVLTCIENMICPAEACLSVVGRDDADVCAGDLDLGGEELLDVVDDDLALLGVEEGGAARLTHVRALQRVEDHRESSLR